MDSETITALAREYASEIHYGDNFFENENKRFLAWLTRRYCLVEKSKAITAYKAMSDYGKEKGVECAQCANYAARVWMKRLFPDLTWDDDPQPVEIIIKRKKK